MTQPKTESYTETLSGIDSAATRLERALQRITTSCAQLRERQHSLKEANEKLNLLLSETSEKIHSLKTVQGQVSKRLDKTIHMLEELES